MNAGTATTTVIRASYPVTVNYGTTIEDLIVRGHYDWWDDDITSKHFPTKRTGQADLVLELVHFNRTISTEDVLGELDRMGLRPAELHELLCFAVQYQAVQLDFPIKALGSVWQSSHCAYLDGDGSKRVLGLNWASFVCRLAAVRK